MDFSKYSSEEINKNINLSQCYYKTNVANSEDLVFIKKKFDRNFKFLDEKVKHINNGEKGCVSGSFSKKKYSDLLNFFLIGSFNSGIVNEFRKENHQIIADMFFDFLKEKIDVIKFINSQENLKYWLNNQLNGLEDVISNCLINCSINKLADNISLLREIEDLIFLDGKKIDNLYWNYNKKYYMDAINNIDIDEPDAKKRINLIHQEKYKKYCYINLYKNHNLEKIKFLENLGLKFEFEKNYHLYHLNSLLTTKAFNVDLFKKDRDKYNKNIVSVFECIEYALSKLEDKKDIIKKYNKFTSIINFDYSFITNKNIINYSKSFDDSFKIEFEENFSKISLKQIKIMEEYLNFNQLILGIKEKRYGLEYSKFKEDRKYILAKINNKTFFKLKKENEKILNYYFGENEVQKKLLLININKERKKNNLTENVKKRKM